MLNRKFASIRANVKTDKRNSVTQNSNQRLSQSQSMEMQTNYQRAQTINNNILMNLSKEASSRSMAAHDRRLEFDSSPIATPMRNPPHPYVNLLHQQQQPFNNISPYQLQYQNQMSLNQPAPDTLNQSWSMQNVAQQQPLVTHYTAAQIYMRPKAIVNSYSPQQSSSAYSSISKKPPPPEVPKRLSSTVSANSTPTLKKSNGLSRSSKQTRLANF